MIADQLTVARYEATVTPFFSAASASFDAVRTVTLWKWVPSHWELRARPTLFPVPVAPPSEASPSRMRFMPLLGAVMLIVSLTLSLRRVFSAWGPSPETPSTMWLAVPLLVVTAAVIVAAGLWRHRRRERPAQFNARIWSDPAALLLTLAHRQATQPRVLVSTPSPHSPCPATTAEAVTHPGAAPCRAPGVASGSTWGSAVAPPSTTFQPCCGPLERGQCTPFLLAAHFLTTLLPFSRPSGRRSFTQRPLLGSFSQPPFGRMHDQRRSCLRSLLS